MYRLFPTAAVAGFLIFPCGSTEAGCARPDEAHLMTHGCYKTRSGDEVHRPSRRDNGEQPEGASVLCLDGSWSFSEHPNDPHTCSYHGGAAR
jgi:hypothetical protein